MTDVLQQVHGIWMGTIDIPVPLFIACILALHAFWRQQQLSREQAIRVARLARRKRPLCKVLNRPLHRARRQTVQELPKPLAEQPTKAPSDYLSKIYPTPKDRDLLSDFIADLPNLYTGNDLRALAAAASWASSKEKRDEPLVSKCSAFKPVASDPTVDPSQPHTYRPTPIGSGPGQQAAEPISFEQPNDLDGDQLAQQVIEGVVEKVLPGVNEPDVWRPESLHSGMPAMAGLTREQQYYQQYYWYYQQQQQQSYKQFPDYTQPVLDDFDGFQRQKQMYHDLYRAEVAQLVSKLSSSKHGAVAAAPRPEPQSADCPPIDWSFMAQPTPYKPHACLQAA
ncbi:hypothetical protein EV183_002399 [Coemansia sp. RSA 2336]|nr:hypothetical protein EV183_002399 [Coemansia sp. RSA 2336]